jgi:HK97 family phage portal protein
VKGLERIQVALGLRAAAGAPSAAELYGPLAPFVEVLGGGPTASGVTVTPATAMRISSVYACVRILSDAVASVPLILYRRDADGNRSRATDHPLYRLLHSRPNDRHTAAEFRSLMQADVESYGNAYALKVSVGGALEQLVPIAAHRVAVRETDSGALVYQVRPKAVGPDMLYPADRMFHLRGPFGDGVVAASPVVEFRELFGVAYAIDAFLAHSFANGVRPSGIITSPTKLSDKSYQNLLDWVETTFMGYRNAGKPLLLQNGETWSTIAQTNEQAQVVELHDKVTAAIARVYSVPLHMLASHIAQPRANMEQAATEFVAQALRSRLRRWEERVSASLIADERPPRDGSELYAEFLLADLLRGDMLSRSQVYRNLVEIGVMTRNEARTAENLPSLDGLDSPLTPLNMCADDGSRVGGSGA